MKLPRIEVDGYTVFLIAAIGFVAWVLWHTNGLQLSAPTVLP